MAASMPPVMDSSTLQDRLRTREDIDDVVRVASTGLTLGAVLGCEKRPPPGHLNRTLNDIMRDDDQANGYKDVTSEQPFNARMTWKSFKERLRIRRAGSNWASSLPIPASDVPPAGSQLSRRQVPMYTAVPQQQTVTSEESPGAPTTLPVESVQANNTLRPELSRHDSDRAPPGTPSGLATAGTGDGAVVSRRLSAALAEERELQRAESAVALGSGHTDEAEEEEEEGQAAPRVSLMALLEETDRQVGMVGPTYLYEEENQEKEDDDDDEEGGGNRGRIEYNCCVCMLRHKGAAFIPCGHTFCRVCSRELWVTRGNCPLCNGCILEILDIF